MCPNCRAFITTSDRTCPYCGQQVGPRAIDVRQPGAILGGLIPQAHFTTILILLINFGLFIGTLYLTADDGRSRTPSMSSARSGDPISFRITSIGVWSRRDSCMAAGFTS